MSCAEPFLPGSAAHKGELHLEGSLLGVRINETRKINLENEIKRTFIQTDKYMYKVKSHLNLC